MIEYGIFSDEGCVESQIYTPEAAQDRITELLASEDGWSTEDHLKVKEMCPDHDEQPKDDCEECWAAEESEEE